METIFIIGIVLGILVLIFILFKFKNRFKKKWIFEKTTDDNGLIRTSYFLQGNPKMEFSTKQEAEDFKKRR